MHGNVWEWCEDERPENGYRFVRGRSWFDDARDCRSANLDWRHPGVHGSVYGLRPVMPLR